MTKRKRRDKEASEVPGDEHILDLEPSASEAESVGGGSTPPPGGPIPVPYPNLKQA